MADCSCFSRRRGRGRRSFVSPPDECSCDGDQCECVEQRQTVEEGHGRGEKMQSAVLLLRVESVTVTSAALNKQTNKQQDSTAAEQREIGENSDKFNDTLHRSSQCLIIE